MFFQRNKISISKSALGKAYETSAAGFLKKNGYRIIETNFRTRWGEIDIIARDKEYLCFIEVKGRKGNAYADPHEFVLAQKQRRIKKTAEMYVLKHRLEDQAMRFDVVSIIDKKDIELIKDAFE